MGSSRNVSRFALALLFMISNAAADPVPLYTDVAVTLAAVPTSELATGSLVTFTVTATNNGPLTLGYVALIGPQIFGEALYEPSNNTDCLLTVTGDSDSGPFWIPEWFPNGIGLESMEVGETRTCQFTLGIGASFPRSYAFTMGLADYWSDINAANNQGTVRLSRATATARVPTLSDPMLVLLGLLVLFLSRMQGIRRALT